MLRQCRKRFNFDTVKVDTQVPRNYFLIRNDDIARRVVIMNETCKTAR